MNIDNTVVIAVMFGFFGFISVLLIKVFNRLYFLTDCLHRNTKKHEAEISNPDLKRISIPDVGIQVQFRVVQILEKVAEEDEESAYLLCKHIECIFPEGKLNLGDDGKVHRAGFIHPCRPRFDKLISGLEKDWRSK